MITINSKDISMIHALTKLGNKNIYSCSDHQITFLDNNITEILLAYLNVEYLIGENNDIRGEDAISEDNQMEVVSNT